MAESDIEKKFKKAEEHVRNLPKSGPFSPSREQKLKMYSFFKQATIGDNKEKKPWAIQIEKSLKWGAWKKLEGMDKEKAMEQYVLLLKQLDPDFAVNN
ncbi:hypothetical protein MHBO_004017 [Bonamia ostreae]|uniref:ACB domain-containing protein n=1 Tax=Bonamia ostreae TaxID=126728 RepID=A0ABV2ASP0_9EUKA